MSSFMVYRAYSYSLNHSVCVCVYENLWVWWSDLYVLLLSKSGNNPRMERSVCVQSVEVEAKLESSVPPAIAFCFLSF